MDQNPYSIGNHADPHQDGLQGKSFEDAVRGMQIIAAPWREDLCLRVAHALETAGIAQCSTAPWIED